MMIFKIQGLFKDLPKFSIKLKDFKDQHEIQGFQGFFHNACILMNLRRDNFLPGVQRFQNNDLWYVAEVKFKISEKF